MINTIRVATWNQLQDELFESAWNPELGRYRSRDAFRGLSDADYPLATSLIRLGGDFATLEHHLLRNFKKYAHRSGTIQGPVWHWLALAQHYGLPTRLMDWTYSPFFALHFATANIEKFDIDGVIWAVNYVQAHALLPQPLADQLTTEGANVFTVEMLSEKLSTLGELARMAHEPFAVFLEPPALDDRIVNQFAFFSLMSDPCAILNEWLERHPSIWRRIVIPAALKWEIRDKLDQSNITERVLFPGLEGLTRWLKRHYSPRDPSRTAPDTACRPSQPSPNLRSSIKWDYRP